ncbi:MAG: chemotaxis protein MotB, partial [Alphaproteobacteria bacterium]|nr:chemotaxis protein MotB [Alphaproteobacteria bacterium]
MAAGKEPTIIIKKIKKVSGGHHGGAWKVAYADFVTAMMAFFLLLWLLSSTSEAQKEGIADYFTPTTAIGSGTGMGSGGGTTSTDGTDKSDKSTVAVIKGGTPAGPGKNTKDTIIDADLEQAEFDKTQEQIKQAMEELQDELAQNVLIKITPEGLQIDVVDSDKHPMFNPGT